MSAIDCQSGENWTAYHGDSAEVLREIPSDSIDLAIFSPPFAQLFVYSDSERDLSNCRDYEQFFEHYDFIVRELLRVMKPGRNMVQHCMLLASNKTRDGYTGLIDFRGDLIRSAQRAGFIYHGEVCINKSPVVQMQRTKALGLLHKQLKKDSAMSRMGLADYLVITRKPGANAEPISHTAEEYPVETWQRVAEPVWNDIDQSDTLQYRHARDEEDTRHLCPLQLEPVRRAVRLWSNPGDVILSPFGGIGTEGWVAVEQGRHSVAIELKGSYFKVLCENMRAAEAAKTQPSLFDLGGTP